MATGTVVKVSGPLVVAEGLADANMYDVVRVGPQRLIGEIIEMRGDGNGLCRRRAFGRRGHRRKR